MSKKPNRLLRPLIAIAALTACEATATDTGLACVVPEGAGCQNYLAYDISEDEDFNGNFASCEAGVIEPDSPMVLRVFLGRDPGVSSALECSAEISGEFELTITSSFRWREEPNESGVRGLWVDCETPPLAAGNWTFRYGDAGVARVPVPSPQAPIFCLDSGMRP